MRKLAAILALSVNAMLALTGCPEKKSEGEGPTTGKAAASAPANAPTPAPASPPKSGGW